MSKLKRAPANYSMWHDKEVDAVFTSRYTIPDTAYKVGRALQIWYVSDKWEAKGDEYTYYHDFESRPYIYCSPKSRLCKFADEVEQHSAKKLLKVRSLEGEMPFALLGWVEELTVDFNGIKKRFRFSGDQPAMSSTDDKKGLFIPAKDGPIFIRGGKMSVTKRGIVN